MFELTGRIDVIEHDGRANEVRNPAQLVGLWERRNAEAVVATKLLPDGMLYFDLLFRAR